MTDTYIITLGAVIFIILAASLVLLELRIRKERKNIDQYGYVKLENDEESKSFLLPIAGAVGVTLAIITIFG